MKGGDKADRIRMVIMDVDGVLTDGKVYIGPGEKEFKTFNVKDGSAIIRAKKAGLKIAWVSGRSSKAVDNRAQELGVSEVHQGITDKFPVFLDIIQRNGCNEAETAYIGDDVQDIALFPLVGMGITVADAHPEVLKAADYISSNAGGDGAVMEILEMLMLKKVPQ